MVRLFDGALEQLGGVPVDANSNAQTPAASSGVRSVNRRFGLRRGRMKRRERRR